MAAATGDCGRALDGHMAAGAPARSALGKFGARATCPAPLTGRDCSAAIDSRMSALLDPRECRSAADAGPRQEVQQPRQSIGGGRMKAALKLAAEAVATLAVLPAFLLYRLGRLALGPNKAFPGWSQAFALVPGLSGAYLRRAFYRLVFRRCGAGAWVGFGTVFSHPGCSVGRGAYVGVYCCLG